jgi:hypothetical protein
MVIADEPPIRDDAGVSFGQPSQVDAQRLGNNGSDPLTPCFVDV